MAREKIVLFKVFMSEDVLQPLNEVLMSGYIGQGAKVDEFEGVLGDYFGNQQLVTVNAATSALHLSAHLLKTPSADGSWPGLQPGDEVLTSALTCTATNWALLANGLKLKWVDVDPDTCNMDLDDLERKLSPATKLITVVHWGGYPNDLDRLKEIVDLAVDLKIPVISMQPYQREISGLKKNHEEFEFRPEEERAVRKKLKLLMRYAAKRKVLVYTASMMKYVPPYLTRGIRFIPPNGCHVPSKVLKVDSSGNCYPCDMIRNRMKQKSIGNVYEESLEDLWHNKIHQELNLLALNRKCPSCLAGCSDMDSYNAMGNKLWPLSLITRVINSIRSP